MAEIPQFTHRSNLDGTLDTICMRCIATVATVYDEGELLGYEQQHSCNPVLAEQFDGIKRAHEQTIASPSFLQILILVGAVLAVGIVLNVLK